MEFNSTKIPGTDRYINEIIEIGAVKLDNNLKETESFSSMIKPVFSKKLNTYVKSLTKINDKELNNAENFENIINNFINWCNPDEETVFLTWSDTDLHVLFENYKEILNLEKVEFINKYTDLQKYIQQFVKTENNNQISLKSAAEIYGINTDGFSLHRAEDDSRVCAKLLSLTYKVDVFNKFIRNINEDDAYKRFSFKPYINSDIKSEGIDKEKLYFSCPVCGKRTKFSGKFNPKIKAFSNIIRCERCKRKISVSFRFKKNFDKITVAKKAREFVKKNK